MRAVYWVSMAVMWIVTIGVCADSWQWRRKLRRATVELQDATAQAIADAPLADWCRHMNLTVITHTGSEFTISFAELHDTDVPEFRAWNIPVAVTVWSDTDADAVADAAQITSQFSVKDIRG